MQINGELVVLDGVAITSQLEEVFKDFLLSREGGMLVIADGRDELDGAWWQVWPDSAYTLATSFDLVRRAVRNDSGHWRFTQKGKSIFARWLLLREAGH